MLRNFENQFAWIMFLFPFDWCSNRFALFLVLKAGNKFAVFHLTSDFFRLPRLGRDREGENSENHAPAAWWSSTVSCLTLAVNCRCFKFNGKRCVNYNQYELDGRYFIYKRRTDCCPIQFYERWLTKAPNWLSCSLNANSRDEWDETRRCTTLMVNYCDRM